MLAIMEAGSIVEFRINLTDHQQKIFFLLSSTFMTGAHHLLGLFGYSFQFCHVPRQLL
jgi:hypothetical protein